MSPYIRARYKNNQQIGLVTEVHALTQLSRPHQELKTAQPRSQSYPPDLLVSPPVLSGRCSSTSHLTSGSFFVPGSTGILQLRCSLLVSADRILLSEGNDGCDYS